MYKKKKRDNLWREVANKCQLKLSNILYMKARVQYKVEGPEVHP